MEYDMSENGKERCLKDNYTMGSIPVKDAFGVVYSSCREPDRFNIPWQWSRCDEPRWRTSYQLRLRQHLG